MPSDAPPPIRNRVTELLGVEYPIVQAPMGWIARSPLASAVSNAGGLGIIGGWMPLAFMVAFTGLEFLVAFLQAYVFAVLTCIYLNDALNMHH